MKKLMILLLFVLSFSVIKLNDVKAELGNEFYLIDVDTPRFLYLNDSTGSPIPLIATFEFYDTPAYDTYNLRLEQTDYYGNYVKLLSARDYTPVTIGLNQDILFEDYFTKVSFGSSNIAFWRIVYDDVVVHSGAVMKRPEFENVDSNRIELGDYVYNDLSNPDINNHIQYTVKEDGYFIVHFRFDEDWASTPAYDLDIVIHDLGSGTLVDAFTPSDIIGSTLFDNLTGGTYSTDGRNSFVIIPINGSIPPFANISSPTAVASYLTVLDLDVGTYQVSLRNDSGNWVDSTAAPLIVSSDGNEIFDITMSSDYYEAGDELITTFYKSDAVFNDSWSTFTAFDDDSGSFSISDIDSFVATRSIYYDMDATLEDGDTGGVEWNLQITSIAYGVGVDTTYYKIHLEDEYSILAQPNFEGRINNLMAAFNWDNEEGFMLVSFLLFFVINILLALAKPPLSAFVIIDTLLLIFLVFLGFVSIWFSVMLGLILIVGLLRIMRSE